MQQFRNRTYSEGDTSTVTHAGKLYKLDKIFEITKNKPVINVELNKLIWVLEYVNLDENRVNASDIIIPIIVYNDPKYGLTVIDGVHRLTKAVKLNKKSIPAIFINTDELNKASLENINMLSNQNKYNSKQTWDPSFGPSYSPEEMLKMGVFEGKYINAIKDVPASWKKIPKVLGPKDEPDEKLNYYGVKSRQPLSVWKKNGWTTKDSPLGWYQWYVLYWLGRRIEKEDKWQIGRWRSFVARHQGQINADPKSSQKDKRLVQKQALLQWSWDFKDKFTPEQILSNAKKMAKETGCELDEKEVATESMSTPKWSMW